MANPRPAPLGSQHKDIRRVSELKEAIAERTGRPALVRLTRDGRSVFVARNREPSLRAKNGPTPCTQVARNPGWSIPARDLGVGC